MERIASSNVSADLFGVGKHGFKPGNPVTGDPATACSADFFNAIQEELCAVVEGMGLTLSSSNRTQVREAIQRMIDVQAGNYALDTGVANAYVVALSPAITAYTDGMTVRVKVVNASTGASTLNAGGGAVALVNDLGNALISGDLSAGSIFEATYVASANKFYVTTMVTSQALTQAAADARYATITVGQIIEFAGTSAPTGFLACPTSATNVSRTTYAALFAVIGTTWGVGDGSTTFGLPYFPADYAAVQASANVGTTTAGQVLAHTHTWAGDAVTLAAGSGGTQAISGNTALNTGSTGGAANLAAGGRVLRCIKY